MAETSHPDWMNQWQALAQHYASAWQNAANAGAARAPAPTAVPGFEAWSAAFAPTGSQGESVDRFLDGTRQYMALMQNLLSAAGATRSAAPAAAWSNPFAHAFAQPGAAAPPFEPPALKVWRESLTHGAAQLAPLFSAPASAPAIPDASELKAWMKLPAFGQNREQQEHYQSMALAGVEYQEQFNRYNGLMLKASQRGFERFQDKLAGREQPGRQIESLRALYDVWVDAAEEGYAEVALSEEFREAYGALVNAQMRVRSLLQREVERISGELGMPTRSEVDNLGERVQALRREMRANAARAVDARVSDAGPIAASAREAAPRKAAAAAAPRSAGARKKAPARAAAAKSAERTKVTAKAAPKKAVRRVPAGTPTEPSGARDFASRIARFADASLGAKRAIRQSPRPRAGSKNVKTR